MNYSTDPHQLASLDLGLSGNPRMTPSSRATTVAALLALAVCDITLLLFRFPTIRRLIIRVPTRRGREVSCARLQELIAAFRSAQVYYIRNVECIQRAAALTLLLRLHGIPARFVVGCRRMPFYAHAWVESGGVALCEDANFIEHLKILDCL